MQIKPQVLDIEELNEEYKNLIKNPDFVYWRSMHIRNLRYYLGEEGINSRGLKNLKKRNIQPIECNIVSPLIHTIQGIEMQTSYDINVQVNATGEEAGECEEALNQYFYDIQSDEEYAQNIRLAFRDGLIGGLGFCRVFYDRDIPKIKHISPLNIAFDFYDQTSQFTNQYCIYTWEDLPKTAIRLLLGETEFKKLKFTKATDDYFNSLNRLANDLTNDDNFNHRVFIRHGIEVRDGYQGYLNGDLFYTLDKKIGEKLQNSKEVPITINTMTTIIQGRIVKSVVQEPLVINGKIPIAIFSCNRVDGAVPKGLLESVVSVQSGFNMALSKSIAYANAEKTILHIGSTADRAKYEEAPEVLTQPNSVIFLAPEDRYEVQKSNDVVAQQIGFMNLFNDYLKKVTGLEDESKGVPTNAISGVALQQRDINSLRSTAFIFNNFKCFKKQIGTFILQQLQSSLQTDIVINMRGEENARKIVLNQVIEDNNTNTYKVKNDITCMKWNIVIKQTPSEMTMKEKEKENLIELLNSPIASLALQSERLLGLFVSNPKAMKEELNKIMQSNESNYAIQQEQINNSNIV